MVNYNIQKTKEHSLKYKKLKRIYFYIGKYCINQLSKLAYLNCSDTNITNKSVLHLTKLTHLDCSNTYITNKNIKYLKKLTDLYCINTKIILKSKGKLKVRK